MLNIYIGKDNLPKDKILIDDNEGFFMQTELEDSELTNYILKVIDGASYCNSQRVFDRFGVGIYPTMLSTSSKTLLNISQNPDKVFDISEIGANAMEVLVECMNGNVYLQKERYTELKCLIDLNNIRINETVPSSVEEVWIAL